MLALGRYPQVDSFALKASLVYLASFRNPELHNETLSQKEKES